MSGYKSLSVQEPQAAVIYSEQKPNYNLSLKIVYDNLTLYNSSTYTKQLEPRFYPIIDITSSYYLDSNYNSKRNFFFLTKKSRKKKKLVYIGYNIKKFLFLNLCCQ